MIQPLPEGAPATLGEAFGYIYTIEKPTITDLKVMVLVEAAGQTLYEKSADAADHPEVQRLLRANGVEEMKHAGRVAAAIKAMSGEDYPPPSADTNPYLTGHIPVAAITPEGLRKTAEGEFGGDALYARWADATDNEEAAAIFRLNGSEESDHGNRLLEAAGILEAV